jgi:DSF synthase
MRNGDHLPLSCCAAAEADRAAGGLRTLFEDAQICARFDSDLGILWAGMRHPERACFTPELLASGERFHLWLEQAVRVEGLPVRWLVWCSEVGIFGTGGDLAYFLACLESGDRAGLTAYARRCVALVHATWRAHDLPLRTVALVEGEALGGSFEAALACDLVVAERGAKFGFPEGLFGLFPGMGAWSLLARRTHRRAIRELVEESLTRSAEELAELGLVHVLVEPGRARQGFRRLAAERGRVFERDLVLDRVRRRVEALSLEELEDIVALWVERAFALAPSLRRRMAHFARCQARSCQRRAVVATHRVAS